MATTIDRHIAVTCALCEAVVNAKILATHETQAFDDTIGQELPEAQVTLAVCPSCDEGILARRTWEGEGDWGPVWSRAVRVWPQAERHAHEDIPPVVRTSLEESERCFRAGAYTASVVMSGRALEGLGIHFKAKKWQIKDSLAELRDRNIIDPRLFEWGEALRKDRNLAAHASDKKFTKEDAVDLLDFINSICEHVFVLTPKFEAFMARKSNSGAPRPSPPDPPEIKA
jgi:hypothetical protein